MGAKRRVARGESRFWGPSEQIDEVMGLLYVVKQGCRLCKCGWQSKWTEDEGRAKWGGVGRGLAGRDRAGQGGGLLTGFAAEAVQYSTVQ